MLLLLLHPLELTQRLRTPRARSLLPRIRRRARRRGRLRSTAAHSTRRCIGRHVRGARRRRASRCTQSRRVRGRLGGAFDGRRVDDGTSRGRRLDECRELQVEMRRVLPLPLLVLSVRCEYPLHTRELRLELPVLFERDCRRLRRGRQRGRQRGRRRDTLPHTVGRRAHTVAATTCGRGWRGGAQLRGRLTSAALGRCLLRFEPLELLVEALIRCRTRRGPFVCPPPCPPPAREL